MAKKSSRILMGCGIGCGAIILILIGLGVSGYLFVKDKFKDFEAVETLSKQLDAEYGPASQFTPSEDTISDAKIAVFLKIRQSVADAAANLSDKSSSIKDKIDEMEHNDDSSVSDVLFLIKQGMGSFPKIAEYLKARNQTMLENNMGLGEYYFIYITSYFSYLKNSPEDGPPFPVMENKGSSSGIHVEVKTSSGRKNSIKYRGMIITGYIQDMVVPMLKRLLKKGVNNQELADAIKQELVLIDKDSSRLPWQDGLPAKWLKVLEKHKIALENSYYKVTNPIELGQKNRRNR